MRSWNNSLAEKQKEINMIKREIKNIKNAIKADVRKTMSYEIKKKLHEIDSSIVISNIDYDIGKTTHFTYCSRCENCCGRQHYRKHKYYYRIINLDIFQYDIDFSVQLIYVLSDVTTESVNSIIIINYHVFDDNDFQTEIFTESGPNWFETDVKFYEYKINKNPNAQIQQLYNMFGKLQGFDTLYNHILASYRSRPIYEYRRIVLLLLLAQKYDQNSILKKLPKDIAILIAKKVYSFRN